MGTNGYYNSIGTANQIENNMVGSVTYNKANADLLFSTIFKNKDLLSEGEYISEITQGSPEEENGKTNNTVFLGLMVYHQEYHLNIKYATLALLCLLFDIAISKGFASFLFGLFGMDYSLVKLDDMEKCITFKLKEKHALSHDELRDSVYCGFVHKNSNCGELNDDGTCRKWGDEKLIDDTIKSLVDKNVVKVKGDKYVLVL